MDNAKLMELCGSYGLTEVQDTILGASRPAALFHLEPASDDSTPLGMSRFGGAPDIASTIWPRRRSKRFLTFIMQINLAEVWQVAPLDDAWPREGLLQFFFDAGQCPGGYALADYDATIVRFERSMSLLKRFPRPKPIVDPEPSPRPELPPARVRFEPILTLAKPFDVFGIGAESQRHREAYGKLYIDEYRYKLPRAHHQIGGHAGELQEGGAWVAARGRAGFERERIPQGHPALDEIEALGNDWRLLLQIDSDDNLNPAWHYGGDRLYLWAHNDSIRGRSFDRYWTTLDVD